MPAKPILVIGSSGQLARSLGVRAMQENIPMVRVGRPEFDIGNVSDIERTVAAIRPQAVINTAAYTAVDLAEDEADLAFSVNCDAAARLAAVTRLRGIPFVHISTDYVFDGTKKGYYVETDSPHPLNVYGRSKLEGEDEVLKFNPEALVIRTSWVYGPYGKNFLTTMLQKAETEPVISVVNDQHGAPTLSRDLAAGIMRVVSQLDPCGREHAGGLYHLANQGETTWYGFAAEILKQLVRQKYTAPTLRALKTEDYPTKARRPKNSRLDTSKIERHFGIRLRSWQDALKSCCDEVVKPWSLQSC